MDEILKALSAPVVLAILSAAVPGILALWQGRDKGRLEERSSYVANIRADSDKKDARITALERRLDDVESYLVEIEAWSMTLEATLVRNGVPVPGGRPRRPWLSRGGAS